MCEFFVSADPILYESRTRTVRIRGVSTSIRMENFMWDTLAALAAEEGVTTNALIAQFHDEILRHRGDVQNFASFLRVTCLRYLRRKLDAAEGHQPGGPIDGALGGPLDGHLLDGTGPAFPQSTH
ncbi:ribbon-helix-helix domain-containing protein [Azohydromonas lata]|uniref:Ribbon-helix-helix domain-containing protein n=1 Tax=Azohydromonas lata TaxID=45677 RepID=A0ABU5IG07_9BURK|nr:ribbon-helix-helix domain-containing protein [Azohydromonas lata]MDZ5457460.1 ribbon-helix-helix domain-containing protein [Azohydromonas lata]